MIPSGFRVSHPSSLMTPQIAYFVVGYCECKQTGQGPLWSLGPWGCTSSLLQLRPPPYWECRLWKHTGWLTCTQLIGYKCFISIFHLEPFLSWVLHGVGMHHFLRTCLCTFPAFHVFNLTCNETCQWGQSWTPVNNHFLNVFFQL